MKTGPLPALPDGYTNRQLLDVCAALGIDGDAVAELHLTPDRATVIRWRFPEGRGKATRVVEHVPVTYESEQDARLRESIAQLERAGGEPIPVSETICPHLLTEHSREPGIGCLVYLSPKAEGDPLTLCPCTHPGTSDADQ